MPRFQGMAYHNLLLAPVLQQFGHGPYLKTVYVRWLARKSLSAQLAV